MNEQTAQVIAALQGKFPDVDFAPRPLVDRGAGAVGRVSPAVNSAAGG